MIAIEELLQAAKERGASDLHLTAGTSPAIRVDGELLKLPQPFMTAPQMEELLLPLLEKHFKDLLKEQGEVEFTRSVNRIGRVRFHVFKQQGSVAAAIRLYGTEIPSVDSLFMPASVTELTKKKKGLVLITGPAGCGKSTTLAALVNRMNEECNAHIITLEDPMEYIHPHKKAIINQREIGIDAQDYAKALRAALREDPDIIMVGELSDIETISLAITAAETGHLVFSAMHTTGAAATINRMIDIFPPHNQQQIRIQLASVLESIVSQQLIPAKNGEGRVTAYEVLLATPAVKSLIQENRQYQLETILQQNRKLGMQTMDDAIYELYAKKKITADNALLFAQDAVTLQRRLY